MADRQPFPKPSKKTLPASDVEKLLLREREEARKQLEEFFAPPDDNVSSFQNLLKRRQEHALVELAGPSNQPAGAHQIEEPEKASESNFSSST